MRRIALAGVMAMCLIPSVASAVIGQRRPRHDRVPGQWIVTLKRDVTDPDRVARELVARTSGEVTQVYRSLGQFILRRSTLDFPKEIAQDPRVEWIDPDQIVTSLSEPGQQSPGRASHDEPVVTILPVIDGTNR